MLWKRGLIESSSCITCHHPFDNLLHVLRDSPFVQAVWRRLVPGDSWNEFCRPLEVRCWFEDQLNSVFDESSWLRHWPYIFRQNIHIPWSHHVSRYRGELSLNPGALAERSLHCSLELLSAWAQESHA